MEITGKTAIVTGGASGLGEATVRHFAAEGANVAVFDLSETAGRDLAGELGDGVAFFEVDVADATSVQTAIDSVVEKFGALHIVSNCAGISVELRTYDEDGPHDLEEYLKIVMVNQVGTFNVSRLAAEKMAQNEPVDEHGSRGVIVNIASIAAYEGQAGIVAYSASKGAVVGMTLPMARDLSPYGIRVNAIAPGLIHTPMFDAIDDEAQYKALEALALSPQRLGKASEVARLTAHIVENDYINAECIRLDAGARLHHRSS